MASKEKEKLEEKMEKERLMKEIVKRYNIIVPEEKKKEGEEAISLEYKLFKEEELKAKMLTYYEKLCKSAPNLNIKFSDDFMNELEAAINFAGLKVKPTEVISTGVLMAIISLIFLIPTFYFPISAYIKIGLLLVPIIIAYLIIYYPLHKAAWMRIRTGKELLLAVLYMIVYMKTNPNFEGAVRFAASNLEGKLAQDLKEVLWKVEIGQFTTVEDALLDYLKVWRRYNKELVEAIHLIRQSMLEPSPERKDMMLNKAIDLVLLEMDEQMKRYVRELETPVMVLHGLGILLPVMGMIVFPLVGVFMQEIGPNIGKTLFVGYDVVLPLFVFILLNQIFMKRPPTHTTVEISKHPDYIPPGKFKIDIIGKRIIIPAILPASALFLTLSAPLLKIMILTNFFTTKVESISHTMLVSMGFVVLLGMSAALYFYLSCFQKRKLRQEIIEMEKEYEEVLFALGNRLMDELPVETALVKAEQDIKEMKIADFLRIIIKNMTQLNMTFKEAIFNKQFGALRYYPSAMISAIMKAIADAIQHGSRSAAVVMLTIGRYLRNIRTTQEKIEDLLSTVVSSLKFQAYVLVPVISGVVVGIAKLILNILEKIMQQMSTLDIGGGVEGLPESNLPRLGGGAIPSELLQLVVGIYVVEVLIISGMFIARIEAGDDKVYEHDTIWKLLLVGLPMYLLIYALIMAIFGPIISTVTV